MDFLSTPLLFTIRAARILGVLTLVAGTLLLGLAVIGDVIRASEWWRFVAVVLAFDVIPGILLLVLASRVEAKSVWAFYVTIVISIVEISKFGIDVAIRVSTPTRDPVMGAILGSDLCLRWPCLLLAVACLSAIPEVRHLSRSNRRKTRGFEVIVTTATAKPLAPPPPPARQRRARESRRL